MTTYQGDAPYDCVYGFPYFDRFGKPQTNTTDRAMAQQYFAAFTWTDPLNTKSYEIGQVVLFLYLTAIWQAVLQPKQVSNVGVPYALGGAGRVPIGS